FRHRLTRQVVAEGANFGGRLDPRRGDDVAIADRRGRQVVGVDRGRVGGTLVVPHCYSATSSRGLRPRTLSPSGSLAVARPAVTCLHVPASRGLRPRTPSPSGSL